MLSENLSKLMINQVNKELYSSYLYLSIANFYEEKGLKGFSNWFKKQAEEEKEHAEKFIEYLHDNNEHVTFESIEAPKNEFKDYKEPLSIQIAHEKYVTSLINALYRQALDDNDYRSLNFLNWFINEQAEEEKTAQDLLTTFEYFSQNIKDIYEFNELLGSRK